MNGKKEPMMDGRQFHVRVRGVMVLLAAVLVGFLWVLYDLQYVHGAEYLEQSRRKIAKTETVEASRGQILDRYGRVLVGNRASYNVSLDTSFMGEERNAILLRLLEICREDPVAFSQDAVQRCSTGKKPLILTETGAVNDIPGVARALKKANSKALLHCDAVQGFLKVPFSAKTLGADLITISGHKIHAPKGIGALYIRSGLKLPPYIHGGGQERGIRAGTEPTPQIAAFGVAAEIGSAKMAEATKTMAELRTHAIDRLTAEVEGVTVIGGGAPHILSISLPGYRSEVLMNFLEARSIYTSKSSACKKGGRSHVLEAIGLPSNVIDGALRISFSRYTTREDIDALCDALRDAKHSLFPSLH